MRAIGKWIIIEEIKEEVKQTEGGLLLGEKHRDDIRYRRGTIVSPGSDVSVVKEGDTVYFDKVAGSQIELPSGVLKVIREGDIIIVE